MVKILKKPEQLKKRADKIANKNKKILNAGISLWSRCSYSLLYYLTILIFWQFIFWRFFSIRYVFRSLDVLSEPVELYQEIGKAILCLFTTYKALFSIDDFAGILLNIYRIPTTDKLAQGVCSSAGVDGVQGVGKTRFMVYVAVILFAMKWRNLRYNYYVDFPVKEEILKKKERDNERIRFLAREDSVEFYLKDADLNSKKPNIPLLYSNIVVHFRGRGTRSLQREHFSMKVRLYESNIKFASEMDNLMPNTLRKTKSEMTPEDELNVNLIDEFVGLDRQMTDGTLLCDSHDDGAIFKSIRDCQQMKYHLINHEYMYTPKLFKLIFEHLKNVVLKKEKKTSKFLRRLCKWFEAACKCIGFTKLYYCIEEGPEGILTLDREKKFFILPNQVPWSYDDRDLQGDYIPLGYRNIPNTNLNVNNKNNKTSRRKKNNL